MRLFLRLLRFASVGLLTALVEGAASGQPACPAETFPNVDRYHVPGFSSGGPIAAGDVNSDGFEDVVLYSGSFGSSVFSFLGDGHGRLGNPIGSNIGSYSVGDLLLEDFDDDEIRDVVLVGQTFLAFSKGLNDGHFAFPLFTDLGFEDTHTPSPAAGDFDGDGNLDVLVRRGFSVTLVRGNGAGQFSVSDAVSLSVTNAPAVADLDGDHLADAVVSDVNEAAVYVLFGQAGGTLSDPVTYFAAPSVSAVTISDITDDGVLDLVASAGVQIAVLPGLGDGTFGAAVLHSAGTSYRTLLAQDLDGDALPDLAGIPGDAPFGTAIQFGTPGSFSGILRLWTETPGFDLTTADLDADGLQDLIQADPAGVSVLRALRFRQFAAPLLPVSGSIPRAWSTTDVNGDGRDDLLVGDAQHLRVLLGSENRILSAAGPPVPSSVGLMAGGDLNEDGFGDALVAGAQPLSVYLGDASGQLTPSHEVAPSSTFDTLLLADFDGDGHLDSLRTYLLVGPWPLILQFGDGTSHFPEGTTITPEPVLRDVAVADVTSDGRADIIGLNEPGDQALVWVSLGRTFAAPIPTALPALVYSLGVGDVDGDLDADLVGPTGSGSLMVLRGNSSGTFQSGFFLGLPDFLDHASVLDVTGDTIADLVVTGFGVAVFRGLGNGLFASPEYARAPGNGDPTFGDLDGNGLPDLLLGTGFGGIGPYILYNGLLSVTAPEASVACLGQPLSLHASAAGSGPVSYQWRKGGIPLSDGGAISGATTDTLTIDPVAAGDAGDYDVAVTDLCRSVTSSPVAVTVATPPAPPSITAPPSVIPATPGLIASVSGGGGGFTWTLTGGTITSGQGTPQVTFTSGAPGTTMTLEVVETSTNGCDSPEASKAISVDFLDVVATDPFREFINTLVRNGVTGGCGGGNFCPDQLATRAQMAVFLLVSQNGAGYTPPPATGTVFLDVPATAFAAAFIEALFAAQVTAGCGGGNYCPDFFVTRAEMAVFLLRMLEGPLYTPPPATGIVFGDVAAGDFAAAYIEEIANRGITAGCGNGNYCPNAFVPREQMAVFLVLTFQLE